MYRNREDAGKKLAVRFKGRKLRDPLVLAIPRGGVVIGAALARELNADLDVVLSRKLRAPGQPELAIGAISEDGEVYLSHPVEKSSWFEVYLKEEKQFQIDLIQRRKKLFRKARPRAPIAGRSVIVTDDGIATGSTMIAALKVLRQQRPHELIVAVPVASADRLAQVGQWCDETICPLQPEVFWAIGQFYEDFSQVEDREVVDLLQAFAPADKPRVRATG